MSSTNSGGIDDMGKEGGKVLVPPCPLVQSLTLMIQEPDLSAKSTEAIIRIILLFRTFKCLKFIIIICVGIRCIVELDGS